MRKRVKDKKIEQIEKKSRAKYKCPELLESYIYLVRKVSPKANLLNGLEVFDSNKKLFRTDDGLSGSSSDGYLQTLTKTLEDCLSGLNENFCDYIKNQALKSASIYQGQEDFQAFFYRFALEEYGKFRQIREHLRNYSDYLTNLRKGGHISVGIGGLYGADGMLLTTPKPDTTYQLEWTKEGIITEVVPLGLSEALHKVNGERVRSCEICNHIFWAVNKNSETCSESCRNALRQRRHREKNREEINAKRRDTYQSKKDQKEGKKRRENSGAL